MKVALIYAVRGLCQILVMAIIVDAFMSWFPIRQGSGAWKFRTFLQRLTEPFVTPCRLLMQKLGINTGMLDFSPLLALILIELLEALITRVLLVI